MKKHELSGMTERSMKRELDKGMRGGGQDGLQDLMF